MNSLCYLPEIVSSTGSDCWKTIGDDEFCLCRAIRGERLLPDRYLGDEGDTLIPKGSAPLSTVVKTSFSQLAMEANGVCEEWRSFSKVSGVGIDNGSVA